jgi:hypothetical protein
MGRPDGHAWTDALTRSLWLHISTERAFTSPVVGLGRTWSPTYKSSQVSISNSFANSFGILVFFGKNSKIPLQQFGIWVWHLLGIGKRASNRRIYARVGEPRIRLASVFLAGLFVA